MRRYFGLLYGVIVALIVSIGVWWFIFLTHEGRTYERSELARLAADSTSAALLIRSLPEIGRDPAGRLGDVYPELVFRKTPGGAKVEIGAEAIAEIKREARKHRRMFEAEGIFFLLLLAAASTILTLAYRSERDFNRARELFLAGATHELKTPLTSLRLYTETLGRREIGGPEAARIRARMVDDIERLEALLEQILALGYGETASLGPAEIIEVAEETDRILRDMEGYLAACGAEVKADLPGGISVLAPRVPFALVLRNLITNAVAHSPSPARVRVSLERRGKWARLSVQDWGPGIPRRYHEKIFRGFVRVGEASGGDAAVPGGGGGARPGLGLYLVARQTKMMGGRVELKSDVGRGSTFTLVLPVFGGPRR